MNRSTYSMLSEAEKGKITDERNAAVDHYQGIRIGWSKAVYQTEDGVFIMRDYFSKVFNVFGVKQVDANQFLIDIMKAIQLNETSYSVSRPMQLQRFVLLVKARYLIQNQFQAQEVIGLWISISPNRHRT